MRSLCSERTRRSRSGFGWSPSENVLLRTGLLPPGDVYVHPWLDWYFPREGLDARIRSSDDYRRAWIVGRRSAGTNAEVVGPYRISPPAK